MMERGKREENLLLTPVLHEWREGWGKRRTVNNADFM
jgi:hypothetical protein